MSNKSVIDNNVDKKCEEANKQNRPKMSKMKKYSPRYLKRLIKKGTLAIASPPQAHTYEFNNGHDESTALCNSLDGYDESNISSEPLTSLPTLKPSTSLIPYSMEHNIDQAKINSMKTNRIPSDDTLKAGLLSDHLRTWAIENRISQIAFSKLLKILKSDLNLENLSSDARTLLKIDKRNPLEIVKMGDGNYYHFGLRSSVMETLHKFPPRTDCTILNLQVNVDGLPISKSSTSQFWPILGHIEECKGNYVFPIGVYHGRSKPNSCSGFLGRFVEDFQEIYKNGILINNEMKELKLSKILCDAPAKSFLLGVKSHNAYFGCTKCTTEGDFIQNRMTYPDIKANLRTDESFKNMLDEDYHKEKTPLLELEVGLVTQVPLDYMHLVCLGVTKKLLILWTKGDRSVRLFQEDILHINQKIATYRECSITEFARKPRSLDDVDHWKATEFRQFLLYYGPLVMKNHLDEQKYVHFLSLHIAMRILGSSKLCYKYNTFAKSLLGYFIEMFGEIYGRQYINHNVHNLIHLPDDVLNFGVFDNFSCFKFENFMSEIKRSLKPTKNPLAQFVNRIRERNSLAGSEFIGEFELMKELGVGTIDKLPVMFHKGVNYRNMYITNKKPNCFCFIESGVPIQVISIFASNKNCFIQYKRFSNYTSIFQKPIRSTEIFIGYVGHLKNDLEIASVRKVMSKALKIENIFVGTLHN